MSNHAWSLDPDGQAAIRRAEDGRTDPVPTLAELFAAVPWRTALESAAKLAPGANTVGVCNQPHGWLTTTEERKAIRWAIREAKGRAIQWTVGDQLGFGTGNTVAGYADTLRALLARSTPPRVQSPPYQSESRARDCQWRAALRMAGVEVVE